MRLHAPRMRARWPRTLAGAPSLCVRAAEHAPRGGSREACERVARTQGGLFLRERCVAVLTHLLSCTGVCRCVRVRMGRVRGAC